MPWFGRSSEQANRFDGHVGTEGALQKAGMVEAIARDVISGSEPKDGLEGSLDAGDLAAQIGFAHAFHAVDFHRPQG